MFFFGGGITETHQGLNTKYAFMDFFYLFIFYLFLFCFAFNGRLFELNPSLYINPKHQDEQWQANLTWVRRCQSL